MTVWARIQESWLLFWYRLHRALFVSDLKRAEWCARLGYFYTRTSRLEVAVNYFTESVHLMRGSLRPSHPRIINPLAGLVRALIIHQRYEECLEPTRELIALCTEHLGADHPHTLWSLECLASAESRLGNFEDAVVSYRRLLSVLEGLAAPDANSLAGARMLLGYALNELSRFSEAEIHLSRALEGFDRDTADEEGIELYSHMSLAYALVYQGKYEEALPHYKRALTLLEINDGQSADQLTLILCGLAQTHARLNSLERAAALARKALQFARGPDAVPRATLEEALHQLARILLACSRYQEALALYQELLSIQEAHLSPDHPDLLQTLKETTDPLLALRRFEEAGRLAQRAADATEASLGPEHLETGRCFVCLVWIRLEQGMHHQAEQLARRSIEILEARSSDEMDLALARHNLACILDRLGRHQEAAPLHAAIELLDGPVMREALIHEDLAAHHEAMGQLEKAERSYSKLLDLAATEKQPWMLDYVARALERYVDYLHRRDRADRAREVQATILEIREMIARLFDATAIRQDAEVEKPQG